jgi:hypothetical protein
MRAIGYIRVSTDKQADFGVSLEAQSEKVRAMAVVQGAELAELIMDAGESAKSLNRPGMEKLLALVDSKAVDTVIIAKLDRLTRSVKDLAVAKLDRLHLVAMSRGITLQDLLGGWVDAFLSDEGLTATPRLTASAGCRQTDQMIDDVGVTSTSSVLERPEELLAYYAKWTGNQVRENDWQAIRLALSYTPTAIKAGILMSILRTKTRVNSFKYCLGAIDEVAKSGIVGSADHVRYLEMKVEKTREGK